MAQPLIEVTDLTVAYDRETALEEVNLTVVAGDYLGLIGPNGSGKTTLLKAILGLVPHQKGEIRLFGQEQRRFRQWHRIGYVSQKAASFNTGFPATVAEVVATGRTQLRGLFRPLTRADRAAVHDALTRVGLAELQGRLIGELSGGQQQRVFIARALASEPELLVLDEPTVGVDQNAQQQFYDLIRQLRQEMNLTVMLVSHDVGVVATEVTKVACLNRRLHFHGCPEEFASDERLSELYGHQVTTVAHRH